jgi:hypothetical protein
MKRGWILFVCAAIVIASGLAGLEAAVMSGSLPAAKGAGRGTCGKGLGGDPMAPGRRGTIDFDGNCTGYPEEECDSPWM